MGGGGREKPAQEGPGRGGCSIWVRTRAWSEPGCWLPALSQTPGDSCPGHTAAPHHPQFQGHIPRVTDPHPEFPEVLASRQHLRSDWGSCQPPSPRLRLCQIPKQGSGEWAGRRSPFPHTPRAPPPQPSSTALWSSPRALEKPGASPRGPSQLVPGRVGETGTRGWGRAACGGGRGTRGGQWSWVLLAWAAGVWPRRVLGSGPHPAQSPDLVPAVEGLPRHPGWRTSESGHLGPGTQGQPASHSPNSGQTRPPLSPEPRPGEMVVPPWPTMRPFLPRTPSPPPTSLGACPHLPVDLSVGLPRFPHAHPPSPAGPCPQPLAAFPRPGQGDQGHPPPVAAPPPRDLPGCGRKSGDLPLLPGDCPPPVQGVPRAWPQGEGWAAWERPGQLAWGLDTRPSPAPSAPRLALSRAACSGPRQGPGALSGEDVGLSVGRDTALVGLFLLNGEAGAGRVLVIFLPPPGSPRPLCSCPRLAGAGRCASCGRVPRRTC